MHYDITKTSNLISTNNKVLTYLIQSISQFSILVCYSLGSKHQAFLSILVKLFILYFTYSLHHIYIQLCYLIIDKFGLSIFITFFAFIVLLCFLSQIPSFFLFLLLYQLSRSFLTLRPFFFIYEPLFILILFK